MLDQEKIGKFIAERRKNQNMTQKQMAEQLGVSDKAVSKWETGKSMPDNSLLMELCALLEINVNELLSGEKLSDDNYQGKAEENMTNLMEERRTAKQDKKRFWVEMAIGIVGFVAALFLSIVLSGGDMIWYIDLLSVFMIISVIVFLVFVSGYGLDFLHGLEICFRKKDRDKSEVERSYRAFILVFVTIFVVGLIDTLIGVISLLHHSSDISIITANMSVALLSMLYACIADLLLLPFVARLHGMKH